MNSSIKLTNTLLLILSFTVISFAQNDRLGEYSFEESVGDITKRNAEVKQKWMKIESDDKEFSIAFPSDSVIDSEKRSKIYRHRIWGKTNGVTMHLSVYGKGFSQKNLKRMMIQNRRNVKDFKVNDYIVRSIRGSDLNSKFSQTLIIASKKKYYYLWVTADTGKESDISKFLLSIKIKGSPIYDVKTTDDSNKTNKFEKTISFQNLISSPEMVEAYKRKPEKIKRKISYELSAIDAVEEIDDQKYSRNVIMLEQPRPRPPSPENFVARRYDIRLKVQLFANGQVGDITVLAAPNKSFARSCCVINLKKT